MENLNLKVRAFDLDEKEWIPLVGDTFVVIDDTGVKVICGDENYGSEYENVAVIDYTGINSTDTNEEIYEGYIVERKSVMPGGIDIIGEVVFSECQYWIENPYTLQSAPLFDEIDEVIIKGNKFDSPELLRTLLVQPELDLINKIQVLDFECDGGTCLYVHTSPTDEVREVFKKCGFTDDEIDELIFEEDGEQLIDLNHIGFKYGNWWDEDRGYFIKEGCEY